MRPASPFAVVSVALAILTSSVGAWPKPSSTFTARVAANAAALRFGKSIGSPTEGHLIGGARLEDAPYVRVLPHDAPGDVRWGLTPLVALVDRAARTVDKKFPGSVLEVGHLSRLGGGDVGDHASHESGRDADIAFYVKNNLEKQVFSDHMVPFRGDGTASSWPGAKFDDAKNWALVSSFVQDPANVTYIFVSAPIRARLLAYAQKIGAAPAIRNRAALLMMQPHGSASHDDHFHVRIGCPSGQRECIELPAPKKKLHITHVPTPKGRERPDPTHELKRPTPSTPMTPGTPPAGSIEAPMPEQSGSETTPGSRQNQAPTDTPSTESSDVPSGTSAVIAAPNEPVEGD